MTKRKPVKKPCLAVGAITAALVVGALSILNGFCIVAIKIWALFVTEFKPGTPWNTDSFLQKGVVGSISLSIIFFAGSGLIALYKKIQEVI